LLAGRTEKPKGRNARKTGKVLAVNAFSVLSYRDNKSVDLTE
jgi:hypothetical protein